MVRNLGSVVEVRHAKCKCAMLKCDMLDVAQAVSHRIDVTLEMSFPDLESVLAWLDERFPANRSWAGTFARQYLSDAKLCKRENKSCKAGDGPSIEALCKVLRHTVTDRRTLRDLENLPPAAKCTSENRSKFTAAIVSGLKCARDATDTAMPASGCSFTSVPCHVAMAAPQPTPDAPMPDPPSGGDNEAGGGDPDP